MPLGEKAKDALAKAIDLSQHTCNITLSSQPWDRGRARAECGEVLQHLLYVRDNQDDHSPKKAPRVPRVVAVQEGDELL